MPLTKLEAAVRALRDELAALLSTDLSGEYALLAGVQRSLLCRPLANTSVKMRWDPPSKVALVGSYLLRTCTAPELSVDVSIELPASCFLEKDYLDQRYSDKRQLYLAHLAHLLTAASSSREEDDATRKKKPAGRAALASAATDSVVCRTSGAKFVCLPHMQSTSWPVMQIQLQAPLASNSTSGNANETGMQPIEGWAVRLIPSLAPETFAAAKLRPQRCNLRNLGTKPSPTYNNLLRLESGYTAALHALHAAFQRDGGGALREATILLKVWLRQRYGGQAGAPSGFQLSLVLLHLMSKRLITLQMSSYQIVRVALHFLKTTDPVTNPIILPHPASGAKGRNKKAPHGEDSEEDEDEENQDPGRAEAAEAATRATAAADAVSAYSSYFPWVLTDASGLYNFGCGVTPGALRELSKHAASSLAALDSPAMSDAQSFSELLTIRRPLCSMYDAVFTLALPTAETASSAASPAGVLTLPPTSADDVTDGADSAAAAAAFITASQSGSLPPHRRPPPRCYHSHAARQPWRRFCMGLAERCEHIRAREAVAAIVDPASAPSRRCDRGRFGGIVVDDVC